MGLKMKQKASGDIDSYKMHVMLKGYSQVERRVDYKKTFAPIASTTTKGVPLHQLISLDFE
jgi:hypothetical protein